MFLINSNKSIFCGLQASIRKLKSGQIKMLVLSADLKPRYVANQIILQALACNENIRIICVPNLTNLTKTLLNFTCYAFVIVDRIWSQLSQLDQWTDKIISNNFPLPSIINAHFAKRRENKRSEISAMEVDAPQTKLQQLADSNGSSADLTYLHLTRVNCKANQRAFVPRNGINLKPIALEIESLNKIKSDFISLDTYDGATEQPSTFDFSHTKGHYKNSKKKGKTPLTLYRESTIHKIQNNPNKIKKLKNKLNKKKNK